MRMDVKERFWARVDKRGPDECWKWTAGRFVDGYGRFHASYTRWRAHRVAWALTNGPIPDGMCVLHKCDNPSCCNPAHLFLGTQKDNMIDMSGKERQPNRKLTEAQVREIRKRYKAGGVTYKTLGAEYGVTGQHICDIVRRKVWRHMRGGG